MKSLSNAYLEDYDPLQCGQLLGHSPDVYFRHYQNPLSSIDAQASYLGHTSHTKEIEMMEGMQELYNLDLPLRLPSEELKKFQSSPEVIEIEIQATELSKIINMEPEKHPDEFKERRALYKRKRMLLITALKAYRDTFSKLEYDRQADAHLKKLSSEPRYRQAKPSVFSLVRRYMPERDRLASVMDENTSFFSSHGSQILEDLISLCKEKKEVIYRPDERPVKGCCPLPECRKPMHA